MTDGQYSADTNMMRIQTIVLVKPTNGDTFEGQRVDSFVDVSGMETNTQLNTLINDKIRDDVFAATGVTPSNADIKVMKFT